MWTLVRGSLQLGMTAREVAAESGVPEHKIMGLQDERVLETTLAWKVGLPLWKTGEDPGSWALHTPVRGASSAPPVIKPEGMSPEQKSRGPAAVGVLPSGVMPAGLRKKKMKRKSRSAVSAVGESESGLSPTGTPSAATALCDPTSGWSPNGTPAEARASMGVGHPEGGMSFRAPTTVKSPGDRSLSERLSRTEGQIEAISLERLFVRNRLDSLDNSVLGVQRAQSVSNVVMETMLQRAGGMTPVEAAALMSKAKEDALQIKATVHPEPAGILRNPRQETPTSAKRQLALSPPAGDASTTNVRRYEAGPATDLTAWACGHLPVSEWKLTTICQLAGMRAGQAEAPALRRKIDGLWMCSHLDSGVWIIDHSTVVTVRGVGITPAAHIIVGRGVDVAPVPLPHLKPPTMNAPKVPFDTWTLPMSEVWLFREAAAMAAQELPAAKKAKKRMDIDIDEGEVEEAAEAAEGQSSSSESEG